MDRGKKPRGTGDGSEASVQKIKLPTVFEVRLLNGLVLELFATEFEAYSYAELMYREHEIETHIRERDAK